MIIVRLAKWTGLALGGALAYQFAWGLRQIAPRTARATLANHRNMGRLGIASSHTEETDIYTRTHSVVDGIERVVYTPKNRRFETPIVMQHGMWHGAWCWETWQAALAEWGWETHAHSLPGHAASPTQTPIERCTLDYYLGFLKAEVDRHARKPVLIGHSMGGALAQWYLKDVADLPAAVLVAPWPHELILSGSGIHFILADPIGMLLSWLARRALHTRTPASAARALLSPTAIYTPEELHARLTPESMLVLLQHMPPFWRAPQKISTPMLLLAGQNDAVVNEHALRLSARHYGAEFRVWPGAAHNLMMEHNHRDIARQMHEWLVGQGIP